MTEFRPHISLYRPVRRCHRVSLADEIPRYPVPGNAGAGDEMTDRPLVAALEGVKREAKTLKIIGSFPLEFADPPAAALSDRLR